jgi:hypothetical protein
LVDHDGTVVSSDRIIRQLEGLACHDDTVLNYAELPFAAECSLSGGHPRLTLDSEGHLRISVEVESTRKLTHKESNALREDFKGQLTDGIGAGCFDGLSAATGLSVQVSYPMRANYTQNEGRAWKTKPSTPRGNEQKITAVAKLVEKMDAKPRKSPDRSRSGAPGDSGSAVTQEKPNFRKLFRLLAKPERDSLFEEIKAEVEACGNDLSSIGDREYPYGNFRDPKLLRLLLKAGLPPDILDEKGYSLLCHAAGSPKCIEMLLKLGVNVNRICEDVYRRTALHCAANVGSRAGVEFLLASGADPSIKDDYGRTPLQCIDRFTPARDRQAIELLLQTTTTVEDEA